MRLTQEQILAMPRRAWEGPVRADVIVVMDALRKVELPPGQRIALGLPEDWQRQITPGFVQLVLDVAERHREALDELARR